MRIDTGGNVLVGTTSSSGKLTVSDSAAETKVAINNTGTGGLNWWIGSTNNSSGAVGGGKLAFYDQTNNSARIVIDSSGNVLIGKTSAGTSVGPQFSANGSGIMAAGAVSSGFAWFDFVRNGSYVGAIRSDGGSNTSYNTTSDYRLKYNIASMTGALAKVMQLKPVTYKWKADDKDGQGFIAHELQEVVPDCVSGTKDYVDEDGNPRYQSIDTSFLVATLTAAIQEQQTLITALTARVGMLEEIIKGST
jgi:hypothetical protein